MKIIIKTTQEGINAAAKGVDEINKEVIFKTFEPLLDCTNEVNNTEIDHAKDSDVVIPMFNLIEYNERHEKKTRNILWQYTEMNHLLLLMMTTQKIPEPFKYKGKITEKTPANGNTKDVEIAAPLKY